MFSQSGKASPSFGSESAGRRNGAGRPGASRSWAGSAAGRPAARRRARRTCPRSSRNVWLRRISPRSARPASRETSTPRTGSSEPGSRAARKFDIAVTGLRPPRLQSPAPPSCPCRRRETPRARIADSAAASRSRGRTETRPSRRCGSIDCRMCAASPIAGAVLRCAGSARIWRRGISGSCRTISSRRCSLVRTHSRSGGISGRKPVHRGLDQRALADDRRAPAWRGGAGCAARSVCRGLRPESGRNEFGMAYWTG